MVSAYWINRPNIYVGVISALPNYSIEASSNQQATRIMTRLPSPARGILRAPRAFDSLPSSTGFLLIAALLASGCHALQMTGGNLIALRLTASSGTLSASAAVISIDEITPSGTIVQTLSVTSTGTYACTLPGTSTSISGKLTIGAAGLYASFACINAAGGTSSVVSTNNKRGAVFVFPNGTTTPMTRLTQYDAPAREAYCATANTSPLDYYMVRANG